MFKSRVVQLSIIRKNAGETDDEKLLKDLVLTPKKAKITT